MTRINQLVDNFLSWITSLSSIHYFTHSLWPGFNDRRVVCFGRCATGQLSVSAGCSDLTDPLRRPSPAHRWDPSQRLTPEQAARHPFLGGRLGSLPPPPPPVTTATAADEAAFSIYKIYRGRRPIRDTAAAPVAEVAAAPAPAQAPAPAPAPAPAAAAVGSRQDSGVRQEGGERGETPPGRGGADDAPADGGSAEEPPPPAAADKSQLPPPPAQSRTSTAAAHEEGGTFLPPIL